MIPKKNCHPYRLQVQYLWKSTNEVNLYNDFKASVIVFPTNQDYDEWKAMLGSMVEILKEVPTGTEELIRVV